MVHATYMPEDGYWPASFEVVPPQKLALHGQDVANSLRKAAGAVILRFREKNKKTGQSCVFLAFGGFLCHFNLDAREQQAILPRLIRQRSIDCDRESEQPVKSVSISSLLLEKSAPKKGFYRIPAPHYLVTHQAHLKRSPQPDFRYQGDIFYATQKAKFNSFLGEASL